MNFILSPLEQFEILPIYTIFFVIITNQVVILALTFFFLITLFFSLVATDFEHSSFVYIIPRRIQVVIEILYSMLLGMTLDNTNGKHSAEFFPLIFSIFFFISFMNLIGLVPYSFTVTSHFIVTLCLSISIFEFMISNIFTKLNLKNVLLTFGKVLFNGFCIFIPESDSNSVMGEIGARCYLKLTRYFSTLPDHYLLLYLVLSLSIMIGILVLFISFLYYRNDNVKKFLNLFMEHSVTVLTLIKKHLSLFKEEFFTLFETNKDFVLKFHFFFSILGIFFFYYLGSIKPLILLIFFEVKAFLANFSAFKRRFDVIDKDDIIIRDHWSNDLDLKWLHAFLTSFRLTISFTLIITYIPFILNFLPTAISQLKPSFYWNLLIISFLIEICADLHIIFFRNTRVGDLPGSSSSALFKGFTKLVGLIWGEEVSTKVSSIGTKIAENPTITGTATAAGAAAGVAYEKSKHPIVVEFGKKEILADNSFLTQSKQYFFDGAIHTDPHSHSMYVLLDKHFKGVIKISQVCENGVISQAKVRERFLTDPNFAAVFYKNPHCFQPFGLGDKMVPSEAHEANERNTILHGKQRARDMGLIIDDIPYVQNPKSEGTQKIAGISTSVLKRVNPTITPNDLPDGNSPKVIRPRDWYKFIPEK